MRATHQTLYSQHRKHTQHSKWLWRGGHSKKNNKEQANERSDNVNTFECTFKSFILIQQTGLRFKVFPVFWTQEAASEPHGQTTNDSWDGSGGPANCLAHSLVRPASLRPLTASVGTCPRLSNISTLTHTHTHTEERFICCLHAGGYCWGCLWEVSHTSVCTHGSINRVSGLFFLSFFIFPRTLENKWRLNGCWIYLNEK